MLLKLIASYANSFIKRKILIKELGPIKIIIVCNYEMMKI